ncbi:MAG: class I SAM-dependent methyltransferase [Eggerthellaceae bacterium]|jgi:O-methyltransferase involved in polyketide biosynthesis
MTEKTPIEHGSLEESMMMPLYAQALCAQRFGDLFPDPGAIEAIARADYDFGRFKLKDAAILPQGLRNRIFADQIREFLSHHPNGTVVDLGAGCDTFFPQVDNGTCRWVNIDSAESIDARNRLMPKRARQADLAFSIFDPDWFSQVSADSDKGVLFIANGELGYYQPSAVQLLVVSIAEEFPGCQIVFDTVSTGNMKRANKAAQKAGTSPIRFAVDDVQELRSWDASITDAQDVGQVPSDVMGSKKLPLSVRIALFSGGSAGMTKVVRLQSRLAG